MNGVETVHSLYSKRLSQWTLVRDCLEGEEKIKEKGTVYLPKTKGQSDKRYNAYKLRAEWNNYTKRVLNGLHGLVFRKKPTCTYPDKFKSYIDNIDMKGNSVYKFAANVFKDSLPITFGGLLVDYPVTDGIKTVAEAEKQGIRAYMKYYPAESIINWKTKCINGIEKISMIVLKENYEEEDPTNEFSHNLKERYRVLEIKNGKYQQRIFKPTDKKEFIECEIIPININGEQETEIPFFFLYEETPVVPYMLDLAKANISHYRKSADYENGVHLTTIPTGYVTGHAQGIIDEDTNEKEVVNLGEDEFLFIPEADAKVGTLCYAGEGLTHAEHGLEATLANMAILGSRLVTSEKGTSESADSAKIHRAGENACLADHAGLVSEAFTKALQKIADWEGVEGSVKFELSKDYDTLAFDANVINAIANISREYKFPMPYIFDILKKGEYTPDDSSLEEYAILIDMEKAGYTASEIIDAFKTYRNTGVLPVVKQKENLINNPQDNNSDNISIKQPQKSDNTSYA